MRCMCKRSSTHLQDNNVRKVPIIHIDQPLSPSQTTFILLDKNSHCCPHPTVMPIEPYGKNTYRCANQAEVTMDNFSLNCPTSCGLSVTTTSAFCTVDLVTSGERLIRRFESICLEHEMPNSDVAGSVAVAFRWSVKYENSSVDLNAEPHKSASCFPRL